MRVKYGINNVTFGKYWDRYEIDPLWNPSEFSWTVWDDEEIEGGGSTLLLFEDHTGDRSWRMLSLDNNEDTFDLFDVPDELVVVAVRV